MGWAPISYKGMNSLNCYISNLLAHSVKLCSWLKFIWLGVILSNIVIKFPPCFIFFYSLWPKIAFNCLQYILQNNHCCMIAAGWKRLKWCRQRMMNCVTWLVFCVEPVWKWIGCLKKGAPHAVLIRFWLFDHRWVLLDCGFPLQLELWRSVIPHNICKALDILNLKPFFHHS